MSVAIFITLKVKRIERTERIFCVLIAPTKTLFLLTSALILY